jgi:hypothetical protein
MTLTVCRFCGRPTYEWVRYQADRCKDFVHVLRGNVLGQRPVDFLNFGVFQSAKRLADACVGPKAHWQEPLSLQEGGVQGLGEGDVVAIRILYHNHLHTVAIDAVAGIDV